MSLKHRKVLFVTSEAHPLMKTGGLGDVGGSLPIALSHLGCDVRVLMPAYRDSKVNVPDARPVATLRLPGATGVVTLLESTLPESNAKLYLVDYPPLFDRPGNPYLQPDGQSWPDNDQRFALLCRAAVEIARNRAQLSWSPDVVHCNDWQTGLVPALLTLESSRPATVFTIHNLAYQGTFPQESFTALGLPPALWHNDGLEFYNQLSFIKGGLTFADLITTVSPHYAQEIQTPEFGCGLDGLLRYRSSILRGIINGIDAHEWDPEHDRAIFQRYSAESFTQKVVNKAELQREFGLPVLDHVPLIGMVGRLAHQKGIDLVLDALAQLTAQPLQMVVLGAGEARYAQPLQNWARRMPQQIAVHVGYSETMAHRIEAGADMFLMPSRFEPCGLNQLYSLRYGTVPIVRRVGGLVDTVTDTTAQTLADGSATGFMIEREDAQAVIDSVLRALIAWRDKPVWQRIAVAGMRQDHSWPSSARSYLQTYEDAVSITPT